MAKTSRDDGKPGITVSTFIGSESPDFRRELLNADGQYETVTFSLANGDMIAVGMTDDRNGIQVRNLSRTINGGLSVRPRASNVVDIESAEL